jgi:hypothetical protein
MARQRKVFDLSHFFRVASLLTTACFPLTISLVGLTPELALSQVSTSPKIVASEIYQALPNLPLENQYVRKETNKVATDSTLIERFIHYHTNVKGRSAGFRMDWKISLADYLGVNDYLTEITYPGHAFLKTSPMKGDRAAIQALSRQQREALIQALVDHYTGGAQTAEATPVDPSPSPKAPAVAPPTASPVVPTTTQLKPIPRPGDAKLLAPSPMPKSDVVPRPGDAQLLMP